MNPFLFAYSLWAAFNSESDVLLKPTISTGPEISLIWVHGPLYQPDAYVELCRKIQQHLPQYRVWIGIIGSDILSIPNSFQIKNDLNRVRKKLSDAGYKGDQTFYIGHSTGGLVLQDYLVNSRDTANTTAEAKGLVLLGSFLKRKYNAGYPISTLTVGGELDRTTRITRITESFYFHVFLKKDYEEAVLESPVTFLRGVTNSQFANGIPSAFRRGNTINPETPNIQAHDWIALEVSTFIRMKLGDPSAFYAIQQRVESTGRFFRPLIEAFRLEGSRYVRPLCSNESKCENTSPWTVHAQELIASLPPEFKLNITDRPSNYLEMLGLGSASLPEIKTHQCLPANSTERTHCTVTLTTQTENVYAGMDVGFSPVSAKEMRVRMVSRKAIYDSINDNGSPNSEANICQRINQDAWMWALETADPSVAARFRRRGIPLLMNSDEMSPLYVVWLYSSLQFYHKLQNNTEPEQFDVTSPSFLTPRDFWIKSFSGLHMCKLLSPARAMEWIYVDGLK